MGLLHVNSNGVNGLQGCHATPLSIAFSPALALVAWAF